MLPDHGSFMKQFHPRQIHLFVGLDETNPNTTTEINVNGINGLTDLLKTPAAPEGKNGGSSAIHHSQRGGKKNSKSSSETKHKDKPSPAKKTPVKDKTPKKSPAKPKPPQIQIPKPNDAKRVFDCKFSIESSIKIYFYLLQKSKNVSCCNCLYCIYLEFFIHFYFFSIVYRPQDQKRLKVF